MYNEFTSHALNPFGHTDRLVAPVRRLTDLMIDNLEKLTRLHLEAARVYTSMGIGQLRAAIAIHDPDSLREYVANQGVAAETVARRAAEDAETFAGIGNDFAADASRIAGENVAALSGSVKSGAQTRQVPKTTDRRTGNGQNATRKHPTARSKGKPAS